MALAESNILDDQELACWLAFDQITGCGLSGRRILKIYENFQALKPAWEAPKSDLKFIYGFNDEVADRFLQKRAAIDPLSLLEQVREKGVQAYPLCAPEFPEYLRQIFDPPTILYCKGNLHPEMFKRAIGVVGTRHPTAYGQKFAKEIARGLALAGVCVVSGMAFGIDSFAHRACLEAGGKTVAVFGSGVDICYPSSNRPLYQLLCEGALGACVSEFFPGTKPEPWRFPARNRIISGLSQGVCVIEAGEESGSLITAHLAFEQSRQVFSVPGRVDSPMSKGTNKIIAIHKAQLVTCTEDILKEMDWLDTKIPPEVPTMVELYGHERDIYELLSNEPVHFDVLAEKTGFAAGDLSASLTMLELAGVVQRLQGDWYTRS